MSLQATLMGRGAVILGQQPRTGFTGALHPPPSPPPKSPAKTSAPAEAR